MLLPLLTFVLIPVVLASVRQDLSTRATSYPNGTDRITFITVPPNFNSSDDQRIYDSILKSRGGEDQLNSLDLTLLNSPQIEYGWMAFFGNLNNRTALITSVRELVLCRIAVLNNAQYEFEQHVDKLTSRFTKSGDSDAVVTFVKTVIPRSLSDGSKVSNIPKALTEQHLAALAYADSMTLDVNVDDKIFQRLKDAGFSNQGIIELTANIAGYNGVSRFLVALDIGQTNDTWRPSNFSPSSTTCTGPTSGASSSVQVRDLYLALTFALLFVATV